MMVFALMAAGAVGVVAVWRLVVARRMSLFTGQSALFAAAGVAALATGRVDLSPRVSWPWALVAGVAAGAALYLATAVFVTVVRRWPLFGHHVDQIYDQRGGLPLPLALLLAAAVVATGEELFWRGLFQARLAGTTSWLVGASITWAVYVVANAASGSLPILAAAIVSGGVWGALALWSHGVLASLACHAAWTALMVAAPPVRPSRRLDTARGRDQR